ncbi:MAG TPA: GAF domain-containing protein [Ignavibacteriaceae bacterium]|nr:GAF domain-containing protein [Ignavibacteriaceae bacterium]
MADSLIVNKNSSTEERYILLLDQLKSLLHKDENLISNLANATAAIKQTFEKVSWVGFYLFDGIKLYLGPFQGKVACTTIATGKGVCGSAAKEKRTFIVPDVNKFPGHIFCDADSKSEVVVPIIKGQKLMGVLDLDSASFNSFDETDKKYLEKFCNFLSSEIF